MTSAAKKGGLLLAIWIAASAWAQSWERQYYYDQRESNLIIVDLKFPSAQRGIALGMIQHKRSIKPTVVITSDGGRNWNLAGIDEIGSALFFLDDGLGWMAANKGLWKTTDWGRTWKKLSGLPGLEDVYFADRRHGWVAGAKKSVYETTDGGLNWKPVAAAAYPGSNPTLSSYDLIRFATPQDGLIVGWSSPQRRQSDPVWLDPEDARSQRERQQLSVLLSTRDGGKSWETSAKSLYGRIVQVALSPDGRGLGLRQFLHSPDRPSEVFQIRVSTGDNRKVFSAKDRLVTDVAIVPNGPAYLAAIEPSGNLGLQSPIPGKVKILKSDDLDHWREMDVDYRAVAHRVLLAASPKDVWAATDTGMILKLQDAEKHK